MCIICGANGGTRRTLEKYLSLIQEARNLGLKLAQPWETVTGKAHQHCIEKLIGLVRLKREKAKPT